MSETTPIEGPPGASPYSVDQWSQALQALSDLLLANHGIVSSIALSRELRKRYSIQDPRPVIVGLTYADPEDLRARGLEVPKFEFRHLGRSFYSVAQYNEAIEEAQAETEREAEDAGRSVEAVPEEEEIAVTRANRQAEARLSTYVKRALDTLYSTDYVPEEAPFVFDVHSERAGTAFENIDILAVHWRSQSLVDLVTVEVKLEFVPQVVQQAIHYLCFSNRVWIAVPVSSDPSQAAVELRDRNPQLFEYVINHGVGILACHRRPGRSYEVFPIHWPRRCDSDPLARELFLDRYREHLEEAGVLERRKKGLFPGFR
ncbi:MAG: hypothetical protein ACRD3J_20145 [Thermoanaerobaculia bacterium]